MPRTAEGAWVDKRGKLVCGCGGYHFPHRKTGGACMHGPPARVDYYHALRQGMPENDCMAMLGVGDLRRLYPYPGDA